MMLHIYTYFFVFSFLCSYSIINPKDGLMEDQDMLSRELSSNGSIKFNFKSLSHISSNISVTKNPNDTEDALLTQTKMQTPETSHGSFDINEDKEISYKRFIQNARDEYSVQQMEKFLK